MFWDKPILAIETSCDETAAAVVHGRTILSNIVASQVAMHQKWGGVLPEAAARLHVESIVPVLDEALTASGIDRPAAVAVTVAPGLVGALSVGLSAAKALASAWKVPLVGVHHLEGHLMSPWGDPSVETLPYPHLALIVSGGHTELVDVRAPGEYRLIGETRDDAAGEAFDKGARLLGLGYPGGKAIQDAALSGDPKRYDLPRSLRNDPFNFSFSGLKTAMLRLVEKEGSSLDIADAAASLQQAVVDSLTSKTVRAVRELDASAVCLVGGVSANKALRESLAKECQRHGVRLYVPPFELSTDNAAMIGLAGSFRLARGEASTMDIECASTAPLW